MRVLPLLLAALFVTTASPASAGDPTIGFDGDSFRAVAPFVEYTTVDPSMCSVPEPTRTLTSALAAEYDGYGGLDLDVGALYCTWDYAFGGCVQAASSYACTQRPNATSIRKVVVSLAPSDPTVAYVSFLEYKPAARCCTGIVYLAWNATLSRIPTGMPYVSDGTGDD